MMPTLMSAPSEAAGVSAAVSVGVSAAVSVVVSAAVSVVVSAAVSVEAAGLLRAGAEGGDHGDRQEQSKNLFHCVFLAFKICVGLPQAFACHGSI